MESGEILGGRWGERVWGSGVGGGPSRPPLCEEERAGGKVYRVVMSSLLL